ncbi:MAG: hypothetical protein GX577_14380 [Leptolinea sp.]|nr:hypothetical protein [Leptolinea sp.]
MDKLNESNVLTSKVAINRKRTWHSGVILVAIYCIIAGLAEIWVGITGNWMGILSTPLKPSFWTALIGIFYLLAGISLIPQNKPGAVLGIVFIGLEILARINLVLIGVYPSQGVDLFKSIIGAIIALALIFYLFSQWKKLDGTVHNAFNKK